MSAPRLATLLARGGAIHADPHGATSPPLYQTATFAQERADAFGEYDYSRTDNPTRGALEALLAELDGGARALTYSSGMAAIAAVCRTVPPGSTIVCGRDLYGGTQRLMHRFLGGVEVVHADLSVDADGRCLGLEAAAERGRVALVFCESPSNPRLEIVDLRAVALAAHRVGARLAVDGTAMTPWLQTPLDLGADIVVHSATKGLAGHGDVTAGVVCVRDAGLGDELAARRNAEGTALAPFDAWLVLRGARTLGVRVERAQGSAQKLAQWLGDQPGVDAVHYPGLEDHPGNATHRAQARGGGVLVTFRAASAELAARVIEGTRRFTTAVSFGGIAASISAPHHMSHASVPPGAAPRPEPSLVRVSVGLEDPDDLIADLGQALRGGLADVRQSHGTHEVLGLEGEERLVDVLE